MSDEKSKRGYDGPNYTQTRYLARIIKRVEIDRFNDVNWGDDNIKLEIVYLGEHTTPQSALEQIEGYWAFGGYASLHYNKNTGSVYFDEYEHTSNLAGSINKIERSNP